MNPVNTQRQAIATCLDHDPRIRSVFANVSLKKYSCHADPVTSYMVSIQGGYGHDWCYIGESTESLNRATLNALAEFERGVERGEVHDAE